MGKLQGHWSPSGMDVRVMSHTVGSSTASQRLGSQVCAGDSAVTM